MADHVIGGKGRPLAVEIYCDLRGRRYARVRRDFQEVVERVEDELGITHEERHWEWEESSFPITRGITRKYVEDNAPTLEYEAERAKMPESEWRRDADASQLDVMELATDAYAGMLDVMEIIADLMGEV